MLLKYQQTTNVLFFSHFIHHLFAKSFRKRVLDHFFLSENNNWELTFFKFLITIAFCLKIQLEIDVKRK